MRPNRKLSTLLLLPFTTMLAKAAAELFIAIIVIVIGAIVVFFLVHLAKTVLPPNPSNQPTNQVDNASQYVISYYDSDSNFLGQTWGGIDPYTMMTSVETNQPMTSLLQNGFTLQYGLDATNQPWVSAGEALSNNLVNVQTLTDNDSNYSIAITMSGQTVIYSTTTNTTDNGIELNLSLTNASVTDADGDTATLATNVLQTMVIERSTDLVTWTPIYTNSVTAGTVQTFTDPDIFSNAFYRTVRPP